jgi:hypothetical protein
VGFGSPASFVLVYLLDAASFLIFAVVVAKAARGLGEGRAPEAASAGPSGEQRPTDVRRPPGLTVTGRGVVVASVHWGVDVASAALRRAAVRDRDVALAPVCLTSHSCSQLDHSCNGGREVCTSLDDMHLVAHEAVELRLPRPAVLDPNE